VIDEDQALEWHRKETDSGEADAQEGLGYTYEHGD